ncbi:MAG: preprotein translocase subunit SecE [Candidatus Margulisiibacteriota bacterium]
MSFLHQSREELSKVIWPSRDVVAKSTGIVVLIVFVVAVVVGSIDFSLSQAMGLIRGL